MIHGDSVYLCRKGNSIILVLILDRSFKRQIGTRLRGGSPARHGKRDTLALLKGQLVGCGAFPRVIKRGILIGSHCSEVVVLNRCLLGIVIPLLAAGNTPHKVAGLKAILVLTAAYDYGKLVLARAFAGSYELHVVKGKRLKVFTEADSVGLFTLARITAFELRLTNLYKGFIRVCGSYVRRGYNCLRTVNRKLYSYGILFVKLQLIAVVFGKIGNVGITAKCYSRSRFGSHLLPDRFGHGLHRYRLSAVNSLAVSKIFKIFISAVGGCERLCSVSNTCEIAGFIGSVKISRRRYLKQPLSKGRA